METLAAMEPWAHEHAHGASVMTKQCGTTHIQDTEQGCMVVLWLIICRIYTWTYRMENVAMPWMQEGFRHFFTDTVRKLTKVRIMYINIYIYTLSWMSKCGPSCLIHMTWTLKSAICHHRQMKSRIQQGGSWSSEFPTYFFLCSFLPGLAHFPHFAASLGRARVQQMGLSLGSCQNTAKPMDLKYLPGNDHISPTKALLSRWFEPFRKVGYVIISWRVSKII